MLLLLIMNDDQTIRRDSMNNALPAYMACGMPCLWNGVNIVMNSRHRIVVVVINGNRGQVGDSGLWTLRNELK